MYWVFEIRCVRGDGVDSVQVDLGSGAVTVISAEPLEQEAVRAAVDEAGYELADA